MRAGVPEPPYGQPACAQFVAKLVASFQAGRVDAGTLLTNAATDTAWFHEAAGACGALCLTRGRLRFVPAAHGTAASPPVGQTFFYFGPEARMFAARFVGIGSILAPFGGEAP